jgi:RNA polymerase sigma factor (sigma-70 family)
MSKEETSRYLSNATSLLLANAPKNILTSEEEQEYGTKIQAYVTLDEEKQKIEKENNSQLYQDYVSARDQFISHNIRLVVKIANQYLGYKVPIEDLVDEGMFGLMTAVEKFDPTRGFRFSTMAMWWIRQAITRFATQNRRQIRYPAHVQEMLSKINKARQEYVNLHNEEPTDEEIADMLKGEITADKIKELYQNTQPITSMNALVGDEDNSEVGDFIPDEGDKSPDQYVSDAENKELIETLMNGALTEQEKNIVEKRNGIHGQQEETLEQIGAEIGLTRERVRQLEKGAYDKMKLYAKKHNIEAN